MEFFWQPISLDSTSWGIWMKLGPYEGGQLVLLRRYPRTMGLSLVNRVIQKRHLQTELQIKRLRNDN